MHSQIPSSCTAPKIHSFFVQQDSKEIRSKQKGFGLSTKGLPGVDAGLSGTGSFNSSSERGNFVSVVEQSGINAGASGFNINVDGATNLVGGVISSTADPALNQLTTGTLTASDLQNRESYKANSIGLSGSISGVGGKDSSGNKTKTDFSAGTPIVLGASGGQSGITQSAIAPGTINITSGDAASQNVAATISRDTSTANAGALIQEFDAARRAEIQEGFAVTKELIQQTGQYFANRAKDEADKRKEAKIREKELETGYRIDRETNNYAVDDEGQLIELSEADRQLYSGADNVAGSIANLKKEADAIKDDFGATSPARIIATALTGSAASNVAGSLGNLVQAATVNVLQSIAVHQAKLIADSLGAKDSDGNYIETQESETVRAALQGIIGCAGAAAGSSGSCSSAALGASASVVINLLLDSLEKEPLDKQQYLYDEEGNPINPNSLEEQQERANLVTSIIGAISSAVGLDAAAAVNAGQIETENNEQSVNGTILLCTPMPDVACAPNFLPWKNADPNSAEGMNWADAKKIAEENLGASDDSTIEALVRLNAQSDNALSFEQIAGLINLKGGVAGLDAFLDAYGLPAAKAAVEAFERDGLRLLAVVNKEELLKYAADPIKIEELAFTDPIAAQNLRTVLAYIKYAVVKEKNTSSVLLGLDLFLASPDSLTEALKGGGQGLVNGLIGLANLLVPQIPGYENYDAATDAANYLLGDGGDINNLFGSCTTLACDAQRTTGDIGQLVLTALLPAAWSSSTAGKFAAQTRGVDDVSRGAVSIIERSADDVNAEFLAKGWFPPYAPGTVAQEIVVAEETILVRVTSDTTKTTGGWYVRAEDIAGKTPEQIKDYLALADTPQYIQTVTLAPGTKVRVGTVGPQPQWGNTVGGGTQIEAITEVNSSAFGALVPLQSNAANIVPVATNSIGSINN